MPRCVWVRTMTQHVLFLTSDATLFANGKPSLPHNTRSVKAGADVIHNTSTFETHLSYVFQGVTLWTQHVSNIGDVVGIALMHMKIYWPCIVVAEELDEKAMDAMIRIVRIARIYSSQVYGQETYGNIRFMVIRRRYLSFREFIFGNRNHIPIITLFHPVLSIASGRARDSRLPVANPFIQYKNNEFESHSTDRMCERDVIASILTHAYILEVSTIPSPELYREGESESFQTNQDMSQMLKIIFHNVNK